MSNVAEIIALLRSSGAKTASVFLESGDRIFLWPSGDAVHHAELNGPPKFYHDFKDGKGPIPAHRHRNPDGTMGGWVPEP